MATNRTPAQLRAWFDSEEFRLQYHTDERLGAWIDGAGTHYVLWAPTAEKVVLNLYNSAEGGAVAVHPMRPAEKGCWRFDIAAPLATMAFDYDVTVDGVTARAADPYARLCCVNGRRSYPYDDRACYAPVGWAQDKAPEKPAETIVYEIHVKDFTWDASSGVPEQYRGKYLGVALKADTADAPVGIAHVKRLGATHVQLMPVYDYGSVDEAGEPDQFNWGYDPVNYNVPEGSYATSAQIHHNRVLELKHAIMALHRQGLRVVMDVVYNHTYRLKESCLFGTVPWYFYRQKADGSASNGSGCGSEIATERSMVARYILDSVMYWAEEYHIDGFRFDLMGMMDVALMNRIRQALDERFGPGEKEIWGEPWSGGECHPAQGAALAHKGNMRMLHPSIGAFCDDTRDAIKGSVMDENSRGFVNGGGLSAERLARCVTGWAGEGHPFAAPLQTISYLSCHDDWTLWDKLVMTLDPQRDFAALNPAVLRANRMAFAILSFCQGRLFMLSGEEFGRTKMGVKNSYNAPLSINRMDWQRCRDNAALVEYYRGLIALRRQLPGLCDKSADAGKRLLEAHQLAPDVASVLMDNAGGSPWAQVMLICNASGKAAQAEIPAGDWAVLADGENSFLWENPAAAPARVTLPPVSAMILGRVR
ncbi:MAG: type I pullulanase [Clostridia bacterium]|nr:type I pullulanase [Clostridia bacterium]